MGCNDQDGPTSDWTWEIVPKTGHPARHKGSLATKKGMAGEKGSENPKHSLKQRAQSSLTHQQSFSRAPANGMEMMENEATKQ